MLNRILRRKTFETDPICGMQVDVENSSGGMHEQDGVTYYFCADGCRAAFKKDPDSFLALDSGQASNPESSAHQDPTAPITFKAVEDPSGEGNFVDVEYQCVCGCTPGARVETGSSIAGSEHCCCGRVHFAGTHAEDQIRAYMAKRAETNMDEDVAPYVYEQTEVTSPSGQTIPISYAQPLHPRK